MKLIAPNGEEIVGTYDLVPGVAQIGSDIRRGEDGRFVFNYAGGTQMFWDDQVTKSNADGQRLFMDDGGGVWPESQLKLVDC